MVINWFPGHMTKSLRMMDGNIKNIDAVVYVLDARAPISCMNPELDRVIMDKPVIFVLNKADLVPVEILNKWISYLQRDGRVAIKLQATTFKSGKVIVERLQTLCSAKLARYKAKGINGVIRAMVVGVPNTGKSTIINNLCSKAKAITGNRAGVTRGKQWVRVSTYLDLLDTPGTLYPKLENQNVALNLAFIGSIRDEVLDKYELSLELINKLNGIDETILQNRYNIQTSPEPTVMLEAIAKSRGYFMRGGDIDIDRATNTVIDDFRKGKLGKIILESPDIVTN